VDPACHRAPTKASAEECVSDCQRAPRDGQLCARCVKIGWAAQWVSVGGPKWRSTARVASSSFFCNSLFFLIFLSFKFDYEIPQ
jgi:hypothetical protein